MFTFAAFGERTKDLAGDDRLLVFNALPQTLRDEAWAAEAERMASRSQQEEWCSSGLPWGFVESARDC